MAAGVAREDGGEAGLPAEWLAHGFPPFTMRRIRDGRGRNALYDRNEILTSCQSPGPTSHHAVRMRGCTRCGVIPCTR